MLNSAKDLLPPEDRGPAHSRVIILQPTKGWASLKLHELWEYRELFFFMVWRDVKVRYKQTVLGAAWAILEPFLTMIVFTLFFGRIANVGSDGLPYPIFSYAGLLPWTFFAQGMSQSSNSLISSANLIRKVYFPRFITPLSSVLAGVVDFTIALSVLFGMMAWYRISLTPRVLWAPAFLLLAFLSCVGIGMWFCALNVQFRDIKYVLPFITQIWLFLTPVIYPASRLIPYLEKHGIPGWCLGLNPMAGVVEGFRWCLLGVDSHPGPIIAVSYGVAAMLFVSGAFYFKRQEKTFADIV